MFNMEKVGHKISVLRKNHNMTQMELADQMGISFQAVSNWERGNSMPDVPKLPELAEIFDVTIDELLGEDSRAVKSAINGEIDVFVEESEDALRELSGIAPFACRNIIGKIAEELYSESGLKELEDIAPFIPKEQLMQIAEREYEKNGFRYFDRIAPFLNGEYLNGLAEKAIQKQGIKAISNIAPFLDKNMLSEYIKEKYL